MPGYVTAQWAGTCVNYWGSPSSLEKPGGKGPFWVGGV
jgi:hypothetical protein